MRRTQEAWTHTLAQQALQEPLIESRLTLGALRAIRPGPRPRTVFVGIGLCSRTRLSVALPVDILGMLLPAERIREAIGASSLTVLVADRHALSNGLDAERVEQRAQDTVRMLAGIRRALGMQQMRILRASGFHDTNQYRATLARVERRAPAGEHAYVKRQIADCEYLHQRCEGIVKVGWSPDRAGCGGECLFDRRFQAWLGDHIGFVYCKAGRVLDERRRKAPPYLVVDSAKRICLEPGEDVGAKLHRYAAEPVVHGVRKHLRALTYSACKQLGPIRGPLEYRVQQLIARVVAHIPAKPAPGLLAPQSQHRGYSQEIVQSPKPLGREPARYCRVGE